MNGNDLDFLNKFGKVHINKKRYYLIQALPHPMSAKSSILLQTTWCQSFAFTEFDFYKDYEESFKKCEIGRIHALLPLHEMAVRFGLVDAHPRKKAGRKPYFSLEGKENCKSGTLPGCLVVCKV